MAVPSDETRAATVRDDEPVLPNIPREESDQGWGDDPAAGARDEWYRRERPPHHE